MNVSACVLGGWPLACLSSCPSACLLKMCLLHPMYIYTQTEQVGLAQTGPETTTTSTSNIVWMTSLTVIIFVIMAMNFRRWRVDYCTRKPETADTISISESTMSYGSSMMSSRTADNYALDMNEISVSRDKRI